MSRSYFARSRATPRTGKSRSSRISCTEELAPHDVAFSAGVIGTTLLPARYLALPDTDSQQLGWQLLIFLLGLGRLRGRRGAEFGTLTEKPDARYASCLRVSAVRSLSELLVVAVLVVAISHVFGGIAGFGAFGSGSARAGAALLYFGMRRLGPSLRFCSV